MPAGLSNSIGCPMSYFREALENWLKNIDVECESCLDVGGGELPVKDRVKSFKVEVYKILDHDAQFNPDYFFDLNYPEKIDERLLEPGRITQVIYVPRPDRDERYGVLGVHTDKLPFASDAERKLIIEQMANQTAGWTQRYLWDLVVEASRLCGLGVVGGDITRTFRQDNASPVLKAAHFVEARVSVSKRINLVRLRKWDEDIQNFVSRATKAAGFTQK